MRRSGGIRWRRSSFVRMSNLFGRLFQLAGMIILPIGLLMGLMRDDVALEVRLLFIGGAFFLVGWLMARKRAG